MQHDCTNGIESQAHAYGYSEKVWRWEGWLLEERTDQPMFDLFLDQQVFMDAIHGNERIDQYSAYTEVTTFEQRGEHLFLEGNILISAYLEREELVAGEAQVEHVEHRLPYEVAVPVYAQIPGMLSVKVQVPELEVEILGPGWLHLEALLLVEGLSAEDGAIITCGAQEFRLEPQAYPQELDESAHGEATAESEAPADTKPYVVFESDESFSEVGWKKQLQGADRAFHGADDETQVDEASLATNESSAPVESTAPIEHAKELVETCSLDESAPEWDVPKDFIEKADQQANGAFASSETRTDLEKEEQVPIFPDVAPSFTEHRKEPEMLLEIKKEVVLEEVEAPQASYTAVPDQAEQMTAAEWFWKTLSIPVGETRYTLKYRIVQAEETLEEIAGFYHVQMTELLMVNHLQSDYVTPGDILYIPLR